MNRRMALKQTAAAVAALGPFGSVLAQPDVWPSRTITLVLPAAAGSGTDLMARELATRLGAALKHAITHEVAYSFLLFAQRRELHRARWTEHSCPGWTGDRRRGQRARLAGCAGAFRWGRGGAWVGGGVRVVGGGGRGLAPPVFVGAGPRLLVEHWLTVTYNDWRGEPRSRHAKKAAAAGLAVGDCVDCNACVAVCPMGIDIRNGQQLECITCALCIDACDTVMGNLKRPLKLIDNMPLDPTAAARPKWSSSATTTKLRA